MKSRSRPLGAAPVWAVSLISALVFLGVCSMSSPLYPYNDWMDANCFFTVGRSMLQGIMPYRDLIEQKGPLLYLLHAGAALISDSSFLGVFFLEVIAATFFLFLGYRVVALYRPEASLLWIPFTAALVYSARSFCQGDSAEELCLPFIAYALYVGLKALACKAPPSTLECFLVGCFSGCVLWIKFSLLGFYLGWFAAFCLVALRQKTPGLPLQIAGPVAAGVALVTLPVIAYCFLEKMIGDLFTIYFYNNLFLYADSAGSSGGSGLIGLTVNLLAGLKTVLIYNRIPFLFFPAALIYLWKKRRWEELALVFCSWCGFFLLAYGGGVHQPYYSLPLSVFLPAGIPLICLILDRFIPRVSQPLARLSAGILACGLLLDFAWISSDNTYLMAYSREDLPQFQFARIIHQTPDATLLNYFFLDGGFYTAAGILPNCPAFCLLNMPLQEYIDLQNQYVEEGLVDYVVTKDRELQSDHYLMVAQTSFYGEEAIHDYRLYRLTETP